MLDPWVPVGWTALAVGSAGVVTWAVAGGIALSRKSDIDPDANCIDGVCPGVAQSELDGAELAANVATAGAVVAGASAVVGLLAILLGGDDEGVQDALTPTGLRIRF
jgi:hypothetical protein